jgi:hypothetical protein
VTYTLIEGTDIWYVRETVGDNLANEYMWDDEYIQYLIDKLGSADTAIVQLWTMIGTTESLKQAAAFVELPWFDPGSTLDTDVGFDYAEMALPPFGSRDYILKQIELILSTEAAP